MDENGHVQCAFRIEKNGMRNGGCFLSFADYCLFAIASSVLQGPGVMFNYSGTIKRIKWKPPGAGAVAT